jgi:DNA-binding NtrC family response regulator
VVRAANAEQALRQLAEPGAQIDVVLSDIVMPGEMDGLALADYIREHYPNVPIVLISGYSAALATRHDYVALEKPCPPDVLLGALRDATAGSFADASAPPRT